MHVRYIRRPLILSSVVLLVVEVYRIHQLSVNFFVFVMYLLHIYCIVRSLVCLRSLFSQSQPGRPNVCCMYVSRSLFFCGFPKVPTRRFENPRKLHYCFHNPIASKDESRVKNNAQKRKGTFSFFYHEYRINQSS